MDDSPLITVFNIMVLLLIFGAVWHLIETFIIMPFLHRRAESQGTISEYAVGYTNRPPKKNRPHRTTALPQETEKPSIVSHHIWMKIVQEIPDEVPHVLIVGSTGSGKTWLAQAIAVERDGHIAILDPKWKPGKWGGAPAITIDNDLSYSSLEHACQKLLEELKNRQVALKLGTDTFTPLTVIVEEMPTLLDECPTAPTLFKRLGQLGRELRIRVIGLSQSDRVKSLKIEGEGDARNNYTFIRLGDHAVKVYPQATHMLRPATIEFRGMQIPIDTSQIPTLVQTPISPTKWYTIESTKQQATEQEKVIDFPAGIAERWTDDHLKVAMWLTNDPDISQREVARRLWPHTDGRGGYNVKAKRIIEEVYSVIEGEFETCKNFSNAE